MWKEPGQIVVFPHPFPVPSTALPLITHCISLIWTVIAVPFPITYKTLSYTPKSIFTFPVTSSTGDEFHCNILEDNCLQIEKVCNGWIDCFGSEDESNCQNYTCLPGFWKCQNKTTRKARKADKKKKWFQGLNTCSNVTAL